MTDTNNIVITDRFELVGDYQLDKYYIGYKDGEFFRPLCIVLSQVSVFIKYFDGNRKNMSLCQTSEDEEIFNKYNKIRKKT